MMAGSCARIAGSPISLGPDSDCLLMEPLIVYFMYYDRLAGLRDASPTVPGTSK